MFHTIQAINNVLSLPTLDNIFSVFDTDGYIRLNMLYLGPVSLKYLRGKLEELRTTGWYLTENELVFKFGPNIISFCGNLSITFKEGKIFSMELDFDPIINGSNCRIFLRELEIFLKYCDASFFMTYFFSIDAEILNRPLSESIWFFGPRR